MTRLCCILVVCATLSGCASYTLFKSDKGRPNPGKDYETTFNLRGPEASIEHSF